MDECFVMMVEENLTGREIIYNLLLNNIKIQGIIVEKNSFTKKIKEFLKNDYYNPPLIYEMTMDKNIPIYYVSNHNNSESLDLIKKLGVKLIVLGGTRYIEKKIIDAVPIGIINIHPGLLPKYRGCDVVGWSILNGDNIGATSHFITKDYDMGPILIKKMLDWKRGDSFLKIRLDIMKLCGDLASETVLNLEKLTPKKQNPYNGYRYPVMDEGQLKEVEEKLKGD